MSAPKIGFVLLSNSRNPIPSTRISVLNVIPALKEAGFNVEIVFNPDKASETPDIDGLIDNIKNQSFDFIYFQKVHGPSVESVARLLSALGIITIYGVCDIIDPGMVAVTNATIVVTEYLRTLYPTEMQHKIHVVHDGIESPDIYKSFSNILPCDIGSRLRAVLVTSTDLECVPVIGFPPKWLDLDIVGRYPPNNNYRHRFREARWKFFGSNGMRAKIEYLRFLLDPRIRRQAWDPVDVYQYMKMADIGIIPIDATPLHELGGPVPSWKVKSENRLTMMMSMGLPVVATPIPAYEAVIQHGINGFLARTRAEFLECLEALRDPALRRMVGSKARDSVLMRYSVKEQAHKLINILNSLK